MGDRLKQLTARKMIKALQKLGFIIEEVRGSHYHLSKGIYKTTVPLHSRDLSRRMIMNIIKQAGLTIEEIGRYL